MTIQISVLIWTIICFCVLALVLDRLLFRPVLSFMHERRRRMEEENTRRLTAMQKAEEEEAAQAAALVEEKHNQEQLHNAILAETHADAEHSVAEKKIWVQEQLKQDFSEMEGQQAEFIRRMDEKLPELAVRLAEKLTAQDNKD